MKTTSTVHEKTFYFVIQRQDAPEEIRAQLPWADASSNYYGTEGDDTARQAALADRDRLREIFGKDNVRVVRRDVLVIETPVE